MKNSIYILFLFLSSCAQMYLPSGGEKDTAPPQSIEEKCNPRNRSVNFLSKTIVIEFDEYIKLNNPGEQIVISPAMEEKPEYYLKGKKLYIELKSELKPNTTYTLNFGNCITDITENNPASGMTYVFSTGNFIDSLKLGGTVTNAFTNAPEKNVWVLLHKNLSDTSFLKSFPDYLAKTDANGNYALQNLSAGEYNIYALKDGNSDYQYNQPSEEIAFHTETITIGEKNEVVNLKLFNESSQKQFVKSSKFIWPGRLQMVMNKPYGYWNAYILPYDTMNRNLRTSIYKNAMGDTIDLWLRNIPNENTEEIKVKLTMNSDSLHPDFDTITFRIPESKKNIPDLKLKHNGNKNFSLYDVLKLKYDRPVYLNNSDKLRLYKNDSVFVSEQTKVLGYGISLVNEWEEKTDYTLILEDSAFRELYYGKYSKADTIRFSTVRKDHYGNILANIQVSDTNFILELLNSNDKVILQKTIHPGEKMELNHLKPGSYKLRIFYDGNGNMKWDTGNLSEKKQPEKIWNYKESVSIRSNWDFELTWKLEN